MVIGSAILTFRASWVMSLKEKRMVLKSLIEKTRHKFNISIAEVDTQDIHQILTIGVACISNEARHVEQMTEKVIDFMENHTEAELLEVQREIL